MIAEDMKDPEETKEYSFHNRRHNNPNLLKTMNSFRLCDRPSNHSGSADMISMHMDDDDDDVDHYNNGTYNTDEIQKTIQLETRKVRIMKFVVLLFICGIALMFSLSVGTLVTNYQLKTMKQKFASSTTNVLTNKIQSNIQTTFQSLASLSAHITTTALLLQPRSPFPSVQQQHEPEDFTTPFPYFTDPYFSMEANMLVSELSPSFHNDENEDTLLWMSPIVDSGQVSRWEKYITYHNESIITPYIYRLIMETNGTLQKRKETFPTTNTTRTGEEEESLNYYSPIWQIATSSYTNKKSPPAAEWINFNLGSIPTLRDAMDHVIEHKTAVMSRILNRTETFLLLGQQQASIEEEPISVFIVPILDTFDNIITTNDTTTFDNSSVTVVGTIMMPFYWKRWFSNVYNDNLTKGVIAVLEEEESESTCRSSEEDEDDSSSSARYSYDIRKESVTYVGKGDLHTSPYYDDTEQVHTFQELIMERFGNEEETHTMTATNGISLSPGYPSRTTNKDDDCSTTATIKLHIYASALYMNQQKTEAPQLVTGLVLVAFLISILILVGYGNFLEVRFYQSVDNATRTRHIVNTLFPKEIQERMFQEAEELDRLQNHQRLVQQTNDPLLRMKAFLKEQGMTTAKTTTMASTHSSTHPTDTNNATAPIADAFSSATVMFADIAGFTHWSSGREPAEVFTLLETIFKSFDIQAKKYGIFKVETIGDCYMCVCGLPEKRQDHAVAMSIFAVACLFQLKKVKKEVGDKLGQETSKLQIRVGLHSGSVTAGVLRGDKSRFQLFGDTVNTASRMESTGAPSRVQMSHATAELLKEHGKGHWFKEREGGVEAKGKGRLRTYWLIPSATKETLTSRSTRSSSGGDDDDNSGDAS